MEPLLLGGDPGHDLFATLSLWRVLMRVRHRREGSVAARGDRRAADQPTRGQADTSG